MKQMLNDYDIDQKSITMFCDNTSTVNTSKNRVQHFRTKFIDIRHRFIKDSF